MSSTDFRRLLPDAATGLSAAEVAAGIDVTPRDERLPFAMVNMIATADGRASVGGTTSALGGSADGELLVALRRRCDAILAGAGTVRAEGYGKLGRPLVVVSDSLQLDPQGDLLSDERNEVVVLTSSQASLPATAASVRYVRTDDLVEGFARLRLECGFASLACEGGPSLNARLLALGLLHELQLCIAPLLVAGESPLTIINGAGFPEPTQLRLLALHEAQEHLFCRYAVHQGA